MSRIYNLSPDKSRFYYSQKNNELSPGVTCKPTATIECLDIGRWPLPKGIYRQPEDNLTAICRSEEAEGILLSKHPELADTPGNEVWDIVAWAVNKVWFANSGHNPIIGPRWNWDLREALFGLTRGIPFAASTKLTKGGHVVSIVGYETLENEIPNEWDEINLGKVLSIIIDDPYGDRTSGKYDLSKTGWNNHYSIKDWERVWKSTGIQVRRKI